MNPKHKKEKRKNQKNLDALDELLNHYWEPPAPDFWDQENDDEPDVDDLEGYVCAKLTALD